MQNMSGGERQERACRDEFVPVAAHPSSASFSGQNCAFNMPLSAGQLETLGNNLFTATFNDATANQISSRTEVSIAHALQVVGVIEK